MTDRRLWQLAALMWLVVLTTAALFYAFWRWEHLAPHVVWGVGTGALVGAIGLALLGGAAWRVLLGPRRRLAIAIALLGLTPVVWVGLFAYRTQMNVLERQRVGSMSVLPVLGLWSSTLIDAHVRWNYPRRVDGKHATLIDDGRIPEPQALLEQLDAHIARMAAELGQQPSPAKVRWVRGSALGLAGHSVIDWAICDGVEDVELLTYLDRHEAAHATITCLSGADQNPPSLLGEGWAEYQSADRDAQLRYLASQAGIDARVPLGELVSREWYQQMDGPVYWEGGPFVRYLIERFGGPKFFDLYRGVREATFAADVERIVGVPWPQLEVDFWKWVEVEGAKLPVESGDEASADDIADDRPGWQAVELGEGADPKHWRTIVDGYREAKERQPLIPADMAIQVERNDLDEKTGAPLSPPTIFRCAFRDERAWLLVENGTRDGEAAFYSPEHSLQRKKGEMHGREAPLALAVGTAFEMWYRNSPAVDPMYWLPLYDKPLSRAVRIETIVPPNDGSSKWTVIATESSSDGERRHMVELDADRHWRLSRLRVTIAGEERISVDAELDLIQGRALPPEFAVMQADGSRFRGTVRALTLYEEATLRQDVELAVRPTWSWPAPLRAASTWAILWPLAGVTLWGLDRHSQRRREIADG